MTNQMTKTVVSDTTTNMSAGSGAFGTTGPMLSHTFRLDGATKAKPEVLSDPDVPEFKILAD